MRLVLERTLMWISSCFYTDFAHHQLWRFGGLGRAVAKLRRKKKKREKARTGAIARMLKPLQ